ncbi:imidazole glycerol phosphate synthase subunit HisH [bacterium]|nr:imidazole glycerol phosphate synthase subunit HisH [bacterium]
MILIVDYGVGNIGSISSMLSKIGAEATVGCSTEAISNADKLILPGVGHYDKAVTELRSRELLGPLSEAALQQKKPILGICLGAQLLGSTSEEGELPGLGWLDMEVKRFTNPSVRVPHMGWNIVVPKQNYLFGDEPEQRFYFVHSYYMACKDPQDILATSHYGDDFTCAVHRENIFGVQFHPEKSHRFGLKLLEKFANA